MGPVPAVARVRLAVRQVLAELPPGALALVACSGGPDSLALAAAAAFEAPRSGREAGAVTVDHGLQEGSEARAAALVRELRGFGLDPVGSVAVDVGNAGGPEAAARNARYRALDAARERCGADAVLLGHTRDDQAETVLLGLGRGSGARSLAGMPAVSGAYRRPLLDIDRATTRAACEAAGLKLWDDPHNADPAYTRVRVRHEALPALERALGGGEGSVAAALARSAELLRDDADALDAWAGSALGEAATAWPDGCEQPAHARSLDVTKLAELPTAVRRRVLRLAAIDAGSPPGLLAAVHIRAAEALVIAWRGQQAADLPGGVSAWRGCGKLLFARR